MLYIKIYSVVYIYIFISNKTQYIHICGINTYIYIYICIINLINKYI